MLITIIFYAITLIYFPLTFWIAFRRWRKVKAVHDRKSRQITYWLFYILLTGFLYILFIIIFISTYLITSIDRTENVFDADKWKKEPKTRVLMIDDLIKRKMLEKKSKNEIIILLGTPESSDTTSDFINEINDLYRIDTLRKDTDIVYRLGARKGVMQSIRHLEIWFKNDTVLKYNNRP